MGIGACIYYYYNSNLTTTTITAHCYLRLLSESRTFLRSWYKTWNLSADILTATDSTFEFGSTYEFRHYMHTCKE